MLASDVVEDTRTLVHRIRNDLQLVSSIIHAEMSVASTDEARAALSAMDRRMLAINLSYTGDETTRVHLPRYLGDLCAALGQRLGACPDRSVGTVTARRIGMIAAEALGSANRPAELALVTSGRSLRFSVTREKKAGKQDGWMTGLCRELVLDLIQQLGGRVLADGPTLLSFELAEP
jgi:hypothetical protein